jgi:hypothetical protein
LNLYNPLKGTFQQWPHVKAQQRSPQRSPPLEAKAAQASAEVLIPAAGSPVQRKAGRNTPVQRRVRLPVLVAVVERKVSAAAILPVEESLAANRPPGERVVQKMRPSVEALILAAGWQADQKLGGRVNQKGVGQKPNDSKPGFMNIRAFREGSRAAPSRSVMDCGEASDVRLQPAQMNHCFY